MRIERLTADSKYLDGAVDVLNITFSNEYISQALLAGEPKAREIAYNRYRHMVLHAALDLDGWVAVDDAGRVLGLMLVKEPGVDINKTPNAETEHKRNVKALAPPPIWDAISHLNAIEARIEADTWGAQGTKDICYLHFLCTSPAARGQGVARALLAPLLERVEKEGVEIGLITHTEENVKYYERYGFRVRKYIEDTLRGEPIYYWSMTKP